jgi:hypothetical protein
MPVPLTTTLFIAAAILLAAGASIACVIFVGFAVLNQLFVVFSAPTPPNDYDS